MNTGLPRAATTLRPYLWAAALASLGLAIGGWSGLQESVKALDPSFRKVPGLKKKPSTSELIDWLKLLMADDIPDEILTNRDASKAIPPLYGALVKNEQDVHLLERLAFMNRRDSRG